MDYEKVINSTTELDSDALKERMDEFNGYEGKVTSDVSLKISLVYSIGGVLWILFSDKVLDILFNDKATITFLSMIKGWGYVIITSAIIYHLVSHYIRIIRKLEKDIVFSKLKLTITEKEQELVKKHFNSSLVDKIKLQQECTNNLKHRNKLEDIFNVIMDNTSEVIWEEEDGRTNFSKRWYEITGYNREDFTNVNQLETVLHPLDLKKVMAIIEEHVRSRTPYFHCEFRIKTKDGLYKWINARGKYLLNSDGTIYRKIGIFTDVSDIKEYEKKLYHFACYDRLTGLQNRVALNETLYKMIYEKQNTTFALLFVDIDNFNYVNDTLGHTIGDNLLLKVSERLKGLYNNNANLFRIGGDEFIILISHYTSREDIEKKAVDIIRAFKTQFEVTGNPLYVTVSIGVSLYPEHGTDVETLLKNADIAVHKAKETGKNRIVFYNEPMNEIMIERVYLEKCLRTALANNEFELYYQPQLDLETMQITGFEALVRWKNAELGMVPPTKFISIAEETRHIIPIGAWVFRSACEFLKKLHQLGYENLNVSINISMLQLLQDDFAEMLIDTIDTIGLNARQVELEITESILMEAYETIAGKLLLLRSRGISLALDDFGKGYSSLNYLKQLPITTLKIDKTFIDTISNKEKNKSLTELIVNLGKSMNLNVIAEGVETKEQMDYLALHKCNKIQGYYFSKPQPEYEVIKKLNKEWKFQKK